MKRAFTALAFTMLFSTRASAAEPTEAEKRTMAETIFEQASVAMAGHDYVVACPKLEEVVKLQPNGIGARIKLGECYEASGRLASAHASYAQAASMASIAGQNDRADTAHAKASALEPRLSKLTIKVSPELAALPGLSVMRGGVPVTPSVFNVAIAIDGGRHTIAAAAEGREPFTTTLDIDASGAAQEVELRLPLPRRSSPDTATDPGPVDASADDSPGMPPVRIGGIVVGAIGLALAGAGIGVGVVGMGQSDDAAAAFEASENQEDADAAKRDYEAAGGMMTAGWTLVGVGAAATVAGVIMIAVAPSGEAEKKTAFSMQIVPTANGVVAIGAW